MRRIRPIYILRFLRLLLDLNSNKEEIKTKIIDSQYFWDGIVELGSRHLILPAVYGNLKRKNILKLIPVDLERFLKDIYEKNGERNKKILLQIESLNDLFLKKNIDHIFLKGSALLLSNKFDVLNERMIGDIDILIRKQSILKARDLILKNGYKFFNTEIEFTKGLIEKKHLTRMIHENQIAAVELHKEVLNGNKFRLLPSENLFSETVEIGRKKILNSKRLVEHITLNWRFNDYGVLKKTLSLRVVNDYINVSNSDDTNVQGVNRLSLLKFNNYLKIYDYDRSILKNPFDYIFISKVNNKNFNILFNKILSIINILIVIPSRILLGLRHPIYFKRIIKNPFIVIKRSMKLFID
tara:strand:+ start:199 stop:1260 length:1062 start_codon:yes stop_codon:yes gene_type:complete